MLYMYGSKTKIKKHFGTTNALDLVPHYNITPTQIVPVVQINASGQRVFGRARWGLIPSWVKDSSEIQHPINAKVETAAIKPMFRHAFRKSRVLVPAAAFYEWQVGADGKQPWLIHLKDDEPMGLGGLLEHWQGPEGDVMTFSILTTEPNALMATIHNRMPVIIQPADYAAWLDSDLTDVSRIQTMAKPYPERMMEAYRISHKVNNPLHDSEDLIAEHTG